LTAGNGSAVGAIVCVMHVLVLVDVTHAAPSRDSFATCREQFAEKPDEYESADCFSRVARDEHMWAESRRVFEALIDAHPDNFWLPLAYGNAWDARNPDRAEHLYRHAADGFRASGHAEGELLARSTLRKFLFPRGRVDEAAHEAERVVAIGDASGNPLLKAAAWSLQASHIQDSGGDLGHALRLLKHAEFAIFPNGPYRLKRANLAALGQVAFRLGRLDEALAIYGRLDVLATEQGNAPDQAVARFNVFNTTAMRENLLPTARGHEELMQLASRALEAGKAAPHELVTIRSHAALAEFLAKVPGARPAALEHVNHCLTLAARARRPHDEAFCSWIEAAIRKSDNPELARAAEIRALDATVRANNPRTDAYSAGRHMRHSWSTRPRPIAVRDSLAAIDTLETLRTLQDDADSSAALFSAWTLDYYWLSGRLLQEGAGDNLALAFSVTERMRARSLVDVLDRSRPAPDPKHAAVGERKEALEAIAAVQRRLMNPTLDGERRRALLIELDQHEDREQEAQRRIELAFPNPRRAQPEFASLAAVQSALSEQEAVLSFQIGLWKTYDGDDGGGSWLIAVTKDRTTVHRLPDRTRLSPIIPVFVGLLTANEGRHVAAAVRLYHELLAEAVASLPPRITRLIIVPDWSLHHLPFESLRATPTSSPLGARYEIVHVPSATLWLHWRTSARPTIAGRLLTFADPAVEGSAGTQDSRNALFLQGLRFGRLPHAREESRAIQRYVTATRALVGAAASEHALKNADLSAYDVFHFAAHAVSDESHPERSAVLLAAGESREDGLLQAREIEALDLDGRIVVLSACQTTSGALQSGEGVLSLARAFFEAGAHAVVGSRWPLRDADAAALFETFYRHLGGGASLAEALKATQDEARAAGRPPAGWAGLVLLGNGDLRPFFSAQPPGRGAGRDLIVTVTAVCLLPLAVILLRRRAGPR
jgi:CHAT domain-containing protein/tetratricopeptide (TPR) repeat protein